MILRFSAWGFILTMLAALSFNSCSRAQVHGGVTSVGTIHPGDIATFKNSAQIQNGSGIPITGQCYVYTGTYPSGTWGPGSCATGAGGPASIQVSAGSGLSVTPITPCATGTCLYTLSLTGIITAGGPIGDSTHISQITYNAEGQLTVVSSVAIAFPFTPSSTLGCTQLPTFTGDITNSNCAMTITASAVTNSKLANMTGPAIKGIVSGTGAPNDLTPTQVTATFCNLATASLIGCMPILSGIPSQYLGGDGAFHYLMPAVSVTGTHPITSADCNTNIMASGGLYAITIPGSLTGFPAACKIGVINTEIYSGIGTANAKLLSGFPTDLFNRLYPQQAAQIALNAAGTAFETIINPGRWHIPATVELCAAQNGNDVTADGLGSGTGCYATIQTAINTLTGQIDPANFGCAVGLYAGGTSIFSEADSYGPSQCTGITFNVRGSITHTSTTYCYSIGDGGIIIYNANLGSVPILKCNTGNNVAEGAFYGHQDIIGDINGNIEWIPGGSNDVFEYADAQGRFTNAFTGSGLIIGNGTAVSSLAVFDCNFGCRGIQSSGPIGFSANVTMGQALILHSGSLMNMASTWSGAPLTIGASQPTGYSLLITNGTAITGGTTPNTGLPAQNSNFGVVASSPI